MALGLGLAQHLAHPPALTREPAALVGRRRVVAFDRFVVRLVPIDADRNQEHLHGEWDAGRGLVVRRYFGGAGAGTRRGGRVMVSGTAGRPAFSQAPAMKAAEAAMESATRWSTIGSASVRNAAKNASS